MRGIPSIGSLLVGPLARLLGFSQPKRMHQSSPLGSLSTTVYEVQPHRCMKIPNFGNRIYADCIPGLSFADAPSLKALLRNPIRSEIDWEAFWSF